MLTDIYIEPLIVDQDLADQVWTVRYAGEIGDTTAAIAWLLVAG